jgi:hypothetical protein
MLRVSDSALKGHNKSAQGNALGLNATSRNDEKFQPTPSPERAAQLKASFDAPKLREKSGSPYA